MPRRVIPANDVDALMRFQSECHEALQWLATTNSCSVESLIAMVLTPHITISVPQPEMNSDFVETENQLNSTKKLSEDGLSYSIIEKESTKTQTTTTTTTTTATSPILLLSPKTVYNISENSQSFPTNSWAILPPSRLTLAPPSPSWISNEYDNNINNNTLDSTKKTPEFSPESNNILSDLIEIKPTISSVPQPISAYIAPILYAAESITLDDSKKTNEFSIKSNLAPNPSHLKTNSLLNQIKESSSSETMKFNDSFCFKPLAAQINLSTDPLSLQGNSQINENNNTPLNQSFSNSNINRNYHPSKINSTLPARKSLAAYLSSPISRKNPNTESRLFIGHSEKLNLPLPLNTKITYSKYDEAMLDSTRKSRLLEPFNFSRFAVGNSENPSRREEFLDNDRFLNLNYFKTIGGGSKETFPLPPNFKEQSKNISTFSTTNITNPAENIIYHDKKILDSFVEEKNRENRMLLFQNYKNINKSKILKTERDLNSAENDIPSSKTHVIQIINSSSSFFEEQENSPINSSREKVEKFNNSQEKSELFGKYYINENIILNKESKKSTSYESLLPSMQHAPFYQVDRKQDMDFFSSPPESGKTSININGLVQISESNNSKKFDSAIKECNAPETPDSSLFVKLKPESKGIDIIECKTVEKESRVKEKDQETLQNSNRISIDLVNKIKTDINSTIETHVSMKNHQLTTLTREVVKHRDPVETFSRKRVTPLSHVSTAISVYSKKPKLETRPINPMKLVASSSIDSKRLDYKQRPHEIVSVSAKNLQQREVLPPAPPPRRHFAIKSLEAAERVKKEQEELERKRIFLRQQRRKNLNHQQSSSVIINSSGLNAVKNTIKLQLNKDEKGLSKFVKENTIGPLKPSVIEDKVQEISSSLNYIDLIINQKSQEKENKKNSIESENNTQLDVKNNEIIFKKPLDFSIAISGIKNKDFKEELLTPPRFIRENMSLYSPATMLRDTDLFEMDHSSNDLQSHKIPQWATGKELEAILKKQPAVNPETIFPRTKPLLKDPLFLTWLPPEEEMGVDELSVEENEEFEFFMTYER